MALLPSPNVDYSDKDFDSIKLRLQNLVRSVFPEWTDYNIADFGNILLELYAFVGDVLGFYQDSQARQSRIATATQRRALLGLVKLIGYAPATATPAQAVVTITLPTPPTGSVTFPAGTIVLTDEVTEPIRYQLLSDLTMVAGQNPANVSGTAENSESHTEAFQTNGLPNQQFQLSKTPYIEGSAVVTAGNGDYVKTDSFLDSGPTDRHFTESVDQNDRVTLRFGNGINGAIPIGTLEVTYKVGGGAKGRVEANKLRRLEGNFFDSFGNPVQPSVTNALKSTGGSDRQTVAQIKERAPASLRALTRSVAREDFEINVLRLPDIARALMLTADQGAGVPENTGVLYIIPVGGGLPTAEQKAAALNQVTVVYPHTLTFQVSVLDPVYKLINVSAVIYKKSGFSATTVRTNVLAALAAFFAVQNPDGSKNENVDFGANIVNADGIVTGEVALSDIIEQIVTTAGVRKVGAGEVLLNGLEEDVNLSGQDFPQLGTVTLTDGDTGQPL